MVEETDIVYKFTARENPKVAFTSADFLHGLWLQLSLAGGGGMSI